MGWQMWILSNQLSAKLKRCNQLSAKLKRCSVEENNDHIVEAVFYKEYNIHFSGIPCPTRMAFANETVLLTPKREKKTQVLWKFTPMSFDDLSTKSILNPSSLPWEERSVIHVIRWGCWGLPKTLVYNEQINYNEQKTTLRIIGPCNGRVKEPVWRRGRILKIASFEGSGSLGYTFLWRELNLNLHEHRRSSTWCPADLLERQRCWKGSVSKCQVST